VFAHLFLLPLQLLNWPQLRGFITARRFITARGRQIDGLLLLGHDAGDGARAGAELLLPAVESTGARTAAERFSWRVLASGARTAVERFSWRALASGAPTAVERFFFSRRASASGTGSAADKNLSYASRFCRRACSERFRLSSGDPIEGGSGGLGVWWWEQRVGGVADRARKTKGCGGLI
jgi:hypothetical protein